MKNWKRKIIVTIGEKVSRDIMNKISDVTDELEMWTSKNPFNAKYANPANEDEYMREYNKKHKSNPLKRDVSTWSKKDLDDVMYSKEYQYDDYTQKKVRSYFEWKYPGNQKFDATGRPVR